MAVTTSFHTTITVTGMTCEHCSRAVHEELIAVDGVRAVEIDLPSGAVAVHSDIEVDTASLAAAVREAGYELG